MPHSPSLSRRRNALVSILLAAVITSLACSASTTGTTLGSSAAAIGTNSSTAEVVFTLPTPPPIAVIPPDTPEEEALDALRNRPIWLPTLPPGTACPASPERVLPYYSDAYGDWPIYALGGSPYGAGAAWRYGDRGAIKVVWVAAPHYDGPALIRGRQMDGPSRLTFDEVGTPEMVFPVGGTARGPGAVAGWKDRPSLTRVSSPGCYAYQVDGLDFTSILVFEAELDSSIR